MKRPLLRNGLAALLVGIVIVGFAKTWDLRTEQDQQRVAQMTEKMKTVCVGRFLLDLPKEAQYEFHRPRIDGFDIAVFEESAEEFLQRVETRRTQLEATPDRLGGYKNLELSREVKNDYGFTGHVFVHGRDVSEGRSSDGVTMQRYHYESVSVEGLVHANGISVDFSAPSYEPESIKNLTKLIAQLIPMPDNRIPSEPGYCIGGVYIRDPLSAAQGEEIVLTAWLPDRPDILFRVVFAAGTEPDRHGLLERGAESDKRLTDDERTRISRLRAEKRKIGGIEGDELVERFVENNDAVIYSFWWEVNGTLDNVHIPHIVFKMDTGHSEKGPVPSSLSQSAATRLWDKVLSSLRLRSIETSVAQADHTSQIPIGAQALAETNAFAVPASVVGHSDSAPKSIQRRGAWLVRIAQAPNLYLIEFPRRLHVQGE